jgi:hypothetical protein
MGSVVEPELHAERARRREKRARRHMAVVTFT